MNRLARFLSALVPATPAKPARSTVTDRNEAVAELVERCGRITWDETARLADRWRDVEKDQIAAVVDEGWRLARQAGPDALDAAHAADWAFRWTLGIPSDGAIYADTHPAYGRAIAAIRTHAAAVAVGNVIPTDLGLAMSRAWNEAIDGASQVGRLDHARATRDSPTVRPGSPD